MTTGAPPGPGLVTLPCSGPGDSLVIGSRALGHRLAVMSRDRLAPASRQNGQNPFLASLFDWGRHFDQLVTTAPNQSAVAVRRTPVAYLENRRGGGDSHKRAHIATYRAPGRKGATSAEGDFC